MNRGDIRGQTILILLESVGTAASGDTRKHSAGSRRTKGAKPPAATFQAVATVCQVQSSPPDDDSFWMIAVSASSGRNARILVDSGADEHVCPTDFASATPLGPIKGGTLHDAQGHMIEAHGTRTVYMRIGPDGQSMGAEFRVTSVKSPILNVEKFTKNKATSLKRARLGAECRKVIAV